MIWIAVALWVVVAAMVGAVAYGALVEARRLVKDHVVVTLPDLPSDLVGLRIVHIGDTHCRPGRFWQPLYERMVEAVNSADADLILVSGDLAAGAEHIGIAAHWLGKLRAKCGVIAVLGNHDLNITMERWLLGLDEGFDVAELQRALAHEGVEVLHNQARMVDVRGRRVVILGVGDASSGLDDIEATAASATDADLVIMLTHSPDILDRPGVEVADIVLCGHTHGGQMMLPGIGPVWAPVWRGRNRGEGLLAAGEVAVHVTRGVGTTWPVRLWCPPQVAILELRRGPVSGRPVQPGLVRRRRVGQAADGGRGEA